MEGASWSEVCVSLRYHFFLSRPLVMDLPLQRLGGAVSPTSSSTAWSRGSEEKLRERKQLRLKVTHENISKLT